MHTPRLAPRRRGNNTRLCTGLWPLVSGLTALRTSRLCLSLPQNEAERPTSVNTPTSGAQTLVRMNALGQAVVPWWLPAFTRRREVYIGR